MSSREHEKQAAAMQKDRAVRCAVLTISDTRTSETDSGGDLVVEWVGRGGHLCVERAIVKDDAEAIRRQLARWIAEAGINAILCTGGTGIAKRDTTIEVVRSLLTSELEGFGELFRMLSYKEVGAAAMMSRATGGLVMQDASKGGDTFIFAMPGSVNAVGLAMEFLITPQLAHLVWERRK